MPPVAPHLADAMIRESSLSFYPQLADALSRIAQHANAPFFDFTRVPMTTQDCYVDRYHGNEWVYGWILNRIAGQLRSKAHTKLADVFDENRLRQFSSGPCQRVVR